MNLVDTAVWYQPVMNVYLKRMEKMLEKTYQSETQEYLNAIAVERTRQDTKWGEQNHDPHKWVTILMEEVGEVARAVLDEKPKDYTKELVQVAAVCVVALECQERMNKHTKITDMIGPLLQRIRGDVPILVGDRYHEGWQAAVNRVAKALGKMK